MSGNGDSAKRGTQLNTVNLEGAEGTQTFDRLAYAANTFQPNGRQANYFFLGNEYSWVYNGGSNSNNYVAYLLPSVGINSVDTGGRFTPGIGNPTDSTNKVARASPQYWKKETEVTRECWKSGKVGG